MALGAGQILRGSKGTYKVLKSLKALTVYKAQVLSGSRRDAGWYVSNHWRRSFAYSNYSAVVKTAESDLENAALSREYHGYKISDIASSPFVRTLYDSVGSFDGSVGEGDAAMEDSLCLVFEWMKTDLRLVSSHRFRRDSKLPKIVSKSVLSALDLFKGYKLIHTGEYSTSCNFIDKDGLSIGQMST